MDSNAAARVLGRRGGLARGVKLPPQERQRIASLGGQARRRSRDAERRVIANLRQARMVILMRGGTPPVKRMATCRGPLPGLSRTTAASG